jgi:hypothetical protein
MPSTGHPVSLYVLAASSRSRSWRQRMMASREIRTRPPMRERRRHLASIFVKKLFGDSVPLAEFADRKGVLLYYINTSAPSASCYFATRHACSLSHVSV